MITVDFDRLDCRPRKSGSRYRVLDVGCGTGRHAGAAYRIAKAMVIGVDRQHDQVAAAADRLRFHDAVHAHGGGSWDVGVADLLHLPFPDGGFDLVVCSEVLEHIVHDRRAVDEVVRVLRPGGDLVVSVPRRFPERICWALSSAYRDSSGGHVRIYRKRRLVSLLEGAGTRLWGCHFAHSLHTPYWWLKCLVGSERTDSSCVNLYHRFLTWHIMKRPRSTRWIGRLLNPVLGKSVVLYFRKAGRKTDDRPTSTLPAIATQKTNVQRPTLNVQRCEASSVHQPTQPS